MLSQSKWESLVTECQVLGDRLVVALAVRDIQIGKVIRVQEEHVLGLGEILKSRRVVRELVARIRGRGVAKENTLHLARELGRHFGIVAHHVAVTGVCDQDELALGECFENLLQQKLADREGGGDIAEVERSGIKGAARVGGVDKLHVVPSDLLRGCGLGKTLVGFNQLQLRRRLTK